MTLLIDTNAPLWMRDEELARQLQPLLPDVAIHCAADDFDPAQVVMLAAVSLAPGRAVSLPKLKLVQKLGAGVEAIVRDPDLAAGVRVARLRPDTAAREIAEYCLAYVLSSQRNMAMHSDNARRGVWQPVAPRQNSETVIGVLGLGHIGGRTARTFAGLGFPVVGWSRTAKEIDGVECHHGDAALRGMLEVCDYVTCVLPSTPLTRDLVGRDLLAAMKPGAVIINVGRGDLIDDDALLEALDRKHLGGAVLDVFRSEPLPPEHPFWAHPNVTVTPHVSGWHLTGGLEDVAENYRRLVAGEPLLHEIDRSAGY
jgi:glyoxylate/hydroxypyruvate reductase A